jgi:hypothetical protein
MRLDRRGPVMNVKLSRFYHGASSVAGFPIDEYESTSSRLRQPAVMK